MALSLVDDVPQPTSDDFLIADILGGADDEDHLSLETDEMPSARLFRRSSVKRRMIRVAQKQALSDMIQAAPEPGESIHVVSAAKFDFWTWVPVMLDWLGTVEDFYCSTWTASRVNVVELLELWDAGRFKKAHFLTGLYFKRRETAVYSFLLDGIRERGGRYRALRNHAKVILLHNEDAGGWLVVEGSANLTGNPRVEQYVITNDRALWSFHRGWMEEMFAVKDNTNADKNE